MAAEKKFDIIAILAVIAALLLTVLFMNGEALGMQRVVSEEEVSVFTEDDLDSDWYTGSGAEITLTGGATYITLTGDGAEINGSGAYFLDGDVIIYAAGSYVLEGTLEDGSVIVNETSKTKGRVRVLLNGVDIHSEDSAAVDIEEATHVYLTLAEGTDNVLSDGETYSDEAVNANIRGALFSRDDLTINGSGSLTITGSYRHGIVCNDDLRVTGGNIYITAKEDGIHVNESARFTGMELTISAGDDGITVSNDDNEGELLVESGTIRILSCTEGLESEKVTINGGSIDVSFTDDGVNAAGTEPLLQINGGELRFVSADGRDVDGLDSNTNIEINGGTILVSVSADGMNNAIDFGSESGGACYINGGTLIAAGSSGMAEGMSGDSAQGNVMYSLDETMAAGTVIRLTDASGETILQAEIPCSFNELVLSDPGLETGGSYTLEAGDQSYAIEMTDTSVKYGSSGMGGFGGRGAMGGPGMMPEQLQGDGTGTDGQRQGFAGRHGFGRPDETGEQGGFTPPEEMDGQSGSIPPEWAENENGFTPPEGSDGQQFGHGGFGGRGGRDMGDATMDQSGSETGLSTAEMRTAIQITGLAAAVLLFGILAAVCMKNKKNIA